jgi:hypothetical protein
VEKVTLVRIIGFFVAMVTIAAGQSTPPPDSYEARLAEQEQARRSNPTDLTVLDALAGS